MWEDRSRKVNNGEPDLRFFTETSDLLSAGQFENLVREGVYRFHLFTIKLFLLGGWKPPKNSMGSSSRTRFSNCPADDRSKVSVKKSQIGSIVVNFSRSIFPYMSRGQPHPPPLPEKVWEWKGQKSLTPPPPLWVGMLSPPPPLVGGRGCVWPDECRACCL